MSDDSTTPTTTADAATGETDAKKLTAEEIKKAKIRAAKLKAKAAQNKKATAAASTKKEFDLGDQKRFEVKKWNAVALWAWGNVSINQFISVNRFNVFVYHITMTINQPCTDNHTFFCFIFFSSVVCMTVNTHVLSPYKKQ